MNHYIISISCVNEDQIQIATKERDNIKFWLGKIDHEGSSVSIVCHEMDDDIVMQTDDMTNEFIG